MLKTTKTTNKSIAYLGDVITYNFAIVNSGIVPGNQVVLIDLPPNGTTYVAGSLESNVLFTGDPTTSIMLTNPILPNETVTLSFQIKITDSPNPNPIQNMATVNYTYTIDPEDPDGVSVTSVSTVATTVVFAYNYTQQINDLIESVALQEAALAAIANAEGAKIQKLVAMETVTTQELLCLNKSVSDMLESIALLEGIFKQKMNIVNCQINGLCI